MVIGSNLRTQKDKRLRKIVNSQPVLVLDGEWPSALAIVRSLGRRGLQVDVGSSKTHSFAGLSRYCRHNFVYPDSLVDVSGFRVALMEQIRKCSYSLVIPVTDLTIYPLMELRESVEALSSLAMASNEALTVTFSKSRTYDLARSLGIPIPRTVIINEMNGLQLVEDKLTFPMVVKPDRSKAWFGNGTGRDVAVAYAFNHGELNAYVMPFLKMGPVVLQEYVRGEGVGIGALATRGETVFAFQYRRLHEVPLTGGASSYRVSEAINTQLITYVSSLLKALSWDGVAMVEFKMARETGMSNLLEINGRFWGSLPLAVVAGADFPSYLFDLMVHQRRKFSTFYKVGVRCRQLSSELKWLKEIRTKRRMTNAIIQIPSYRSILLDSCRLLNPAEFTDTFDCGDPRPGINDIYKLTRDIIGDVRSKLLREVN